MTQKQLEKSSGIPQNTISLLETKQPPARPGFTTVIALAKALGIDPLRLRVGPDPAQRRRTAKAAAPSRLRVPA